MSTEIISRRQAALLDWDDAPSPEAAFARLEPRRGAFWLDSSLRGGPGGGRHSILGAEPFAVLRAGAGEWELREEGRPPERGRGDGLERLEALLDLYRLEHDTEGAPFLGGAVGWFAYGAPPQFRLAWHDAAAVWDHQAGRARLVGAPWRRPAAEAARALGRLLAGAADPPAPPPAPPAALAAGWSRQDYLAAVARVRGRIAAGEIYQMNLAQGFSCPLAEPPARLYRRLRALNPAPMGAYLDAGDRVLLSSSPERFLEVEGRRVRAFPIKGTRPRGRTPEEDALRRQELLASEKERAELLMIVDLMRSDLGRVCRFGSVRVRRLHSLESFATVHHLVGEIEGELRPEVGAAALLGATFPGGSITGAPKLRAMRVIAEEEAGPRGIFSGAIGYFSACGRIDLNIAIRTIECRGGRASFHVGSGIVWDSDPAAEYDETLAKGKALFAALGAAPPGAAAAAGAAEPGMPAPNDPARAEPPGAQGVFETLLIRGGRPLFFGEHAARFRRGCAHFGLAGAPPEERLREAAARAIADAGLSDGVLRWSAWPGGWSLRAEAPRPRSLKAAWALRTSARRLPPAGPDRACKLLGRAAWNEALAEAGAAGADEALLLDEEGRVVEGAVSNIFCARGGRLLTPPLADGPLPGIIRARVLALAPGLGVAVSECSLTLGDLLAADEVFATNSLVEVKPVSSLDGRAWPVPGPVAARLAGALR